MFPCLVLAPWMAPHQVVAWEKAICHEYTHEIDVLERYEEEARSPSITIRFPAVARLHTLVYEKKDVKFSRANLYARDGYRCQYCGSKPLTPKMLNYDHVVPRSKGGKTEWENIVTSCILCNLKKGHKTLKQSGMKLRKLPTRPHSLPMSASPIVLPARVPQLWHPYLNDRLASLQIA